MKKGREGAPGTVRENIGNVVAGSSIQPSSSRVFCSMFELYQEG